MNQRSGGALTLGLVTALAGIAVVGTLAFGLQSLKAANRAVDPRRDNPTLDADGPRTVTVTPSAPTPPTPLPTGPSTIALGNQYSAAGIGALLARVRIVAARAKVPGYVRDCGPGDGCVFGPAWSDDTDAPDGHNGCDTRDDVLREQLLDVAFKAGSDGCDVVAGHITEPYTGVEMDYATQGWRIQIDHVFPLAAAWDLGAAGWTPAERSRFANDTRLELLAVIGSANMSKGDSTPASWLPDVKPYRCEYVTRYLQVAVTYDLAITEADRTAIEFVQERSCTA